MSAAAHAVVLGSAAGGGFPQWNCRCPPCRLAWAGDARVEHRTQASLAVSEDGERYMLVGASPDLKQQVLANPALQPRVGSRSSPIASVLLLNADVDHVAGLLALREGQPFRIFATRAVLGALAANPIFDVLDGRLVERCAVDLGARVDSGLGFAFELFAVPGKPALWQEDENLVIGGETETTVGALFLVPTASGTRQLAYVPSCAAVTEPLRARLRDADLLFFDGTTWTDDEMVALGLSAKTAGRMGHVAMAGPEGSLAQLAGVGRRRVYVHVNNTNPVLIDGSAERQALVAAGWELGRDGARYDLEGA